MGGIAFIFCRQVNQILVHLTNENENQNLQLDCCQNLKIGIVQENMTISSPETYPIVVNWKVKFTPEQAIKTQIETLSLTSALDWCWVVSVTPRPLKFLWKETW